MTLVRVNPRNKVNRPASVFDNLFNEIMQPGLNELTRNNNFARPAVNVVETPEVFRIELSAPGLDKNDVSIMVENDTLTIESNKEFKEQEGEKVIKREFGFYKFKRTFRLPETIDLSNIKADFNNGILNLNLAKKDEAKVQPPRKIEIE